ncbi:MAG TPA: MlaD family protein, partial [Solirubrobacteraceae bacterium]
MSARTLAPVLALAAVVLAVVLIAAGGSDDDRYSVLLRMNNANGLREGSSVEVGGVAQGTVAKLTTDARDRVIARLDLDPEIGAVGSGARVAISAKNLLGEKVVKLDLGDSRRAQPSGAVIPASRIEESVDLDEVLNVLAPDTRAKLAALIGEAGGGVAGRRRDLSSILRQLPPTLDAATQLLDQLVSDNHTLGRLVDRSDRFVARFAAERKQLGRFTDTAGRAAETVAARRADLRRTLAAAPGTLARLDRFLGELRSASHPLGRAAREVTATAPSLTRTLAALAPFRRSAAPLLSDARATAPQLTALGRRATPVVRRAVPTADALARLARNARPLSRTLDFSVDDIIA